MRDLLRNVSRRAIVAGLLLALTAESAEAASAGRLRMGQSSAIPPPPSTMLSPTVQWGVTGIAGSGYGGSGAPVPVDPGGSPQCVLRHLFLPFMTFADDYTLVFEAGSFDGTSKVRIFCEGNYVDVTTPQWWPYTDPRGLTNYVYGHGVVLDHAAILALNATGSMNVYGEAFSNNPSIANRVMGPYLLYARAPGVGAGLQYDWEYLIDRTAVVDTPDVRYRQLETALARAAATGKVRPVFTLVTTSSTTPYRYKNITSGGVGAASALYTIRPAVGISAIIGDYSTTSGGGNGAGDGLHFTTQPGANLQLDISAGATSLFGLGFYRNGSGSNNILFFDGVEITCSGLPTGTTGTGTTLITAAGFQPGGFWLTRNNTRPYHWIWKDCYIHDMASYGVMLSELILNNIIDGISGSSVENLLGAMQGNIISRIGGYQAGLRVQTPAMTLYYNGAGAATYERSGNNIKSYVNGVQTNTTLGASSYLLTALAAYINANWTDWVAVLDPACPPWASSFMSMANLVPSASITPPVSVTAAGTAFTAVMDIHSDVITFYTPYPSGYTAYENLSISFNKGYNNVATAPATLQLFSDVTCHHNIFADASFANGQAVQQSTYGFGSTCQHVLNYANTFMGIGAGMFIPNTFSNPVSFGAFGRIDHLAMDSVGFGTSGTPAPPTPPLNAYPQYCVIRNGATPVSSANCVNLGGAAETTMYVDPTVTVVDATPLAPLLLPDGKYAGARAPVGAPAAYRGWNLDVT